MLCFFDVTCVISKIRGQDSGVNENAISVQNSTLLFTQKTRSHHSKNSMLFQICDFIE